MDLQINRYKTYPQRVADDFIENWTLFEKVWLIVFSSIIVGVYYFSNDTFLGLAASLTGMLTVVLVAKGRISNYYFGIINVSLYGFLALQNQYYGEVMLNWIFFLPAQFIGLYIWSHNMRNDGIVKVYEPTNKQRVVGGFMTVLAIAGYGLVLKWLDGNLPLFDAASTVLSVMAQILMALRATEQWILWIIVDIITIYLWVTAFLSTGEGLTLVVMWSAYLVNACYGFWNWRKMALGERYQ